MLHPISAIKTNQQYYQKNKITQAQPQISAQTLELSGVDVGKAIAAQRNVSFRNTQIDSSRNVMLNSICEVNLVDEKIDPVFSIEITSNKNFVGKKGVKGILLLALNNQMCEKQEEGNLKYVSSVLTSTERGVLLTCPTQNIGKMLEIINNNFVNAQIDIKHINDAKQLAPVGLFLSRKTENYKDEFSDIPANMSEEDYEKLISKITARDI